MTDRTIIDMDDELDPVNRAYDLHEAAFSARLKVRGIRDRGLVPAEPWTVQKVLQLGCDLGITWTISSDAFDDGAFHSDAKLVAEVSGVERHATKVILYRRPTVEQAMVTLGTMLGAMEQFSCTTPYVMQSLRYGDDVSVIPDTEFIDESPFDHRDEVQGWDIDARFADDSLALWYGHVFATAMLEPNGGPETARSVIQTPQAFADRCRMALTANERLGEEATPDDKTRRMVQILAPVLASTTDHAIMEGTELLAQGCGIVEDISDASIADVICQILSAVSLPWISSDMGAISSSEILAYCQKIRQLISDSGQQGKEQS